MNQWRVSGDHLYRTTAEFETMKISSRPCVSHPPCGKFSDVCWFLVAAAGRFSANYVSEQMKRDVESLRANRSYFIRDTFLWQRRQRKQSEFNVVSSVVNDSVVAVFSCQYLIEAILKQRTEDDCVFFIVRLAACIILFRLSACMFSVFGSGRRFIYPLAGYILENF